MLRNPRLLCFSGSLFSLIMKGRHKFHWSSTFKKLISEYTWVCGPTEQLFCWGEERINHLSPLNEFLIWACHQCRAVSIMIASTPPTVQPIIFCTYNNLNSCSIKSKIPSACRVKHTEINVSSFDIWQYAVQGQISVAEPDGIIIIWRLRAVLDPRVSACRTQRARSATGLSPLHTTEEPWALSSCMTSPTKSPSAPCRTGELSRYLIHLCFAKFL